MYCDNSVDILDVNLFPNIIDERLDQNRPAAPETTADETEEDEEDQHHDMDNEAETLVLQNVPNTTLNDQIREVMNRNMQQQSAPQNQALSIDQKFVMTTTVILPAIIPDNPNYKDQVGTVLYEFVAQLVGPQAPKITGMLIDLPINDIQLILQNYDLFKTRVGQASDLLSQQQNS